VWLNPSAINPDNIEKVLKHEICEDNVDEESHHFMHKVSLEEKTLRHFAQR